jgi:Na+-transporting NADH:ubiquinone oxidoreductase subunit C
MMKGEGNDYSSNAHAIDGMSGATLTADGVNNMMNTYLNLYLSFINSKKSN